MPVSNVNVIDDNGTPLNPADDFHPTFVGGDANNDGKLDPTETWTYTSNVIAPALANNGTASAIAANFNRTTIKAGNVIWFSSSFKPDSLPANVTSFTVRGSTIQITNGTTTYNVAVPDAIVTFSNAVTTATTTFDATKNAWVTVLPKSASGNTFLTAVPFVVPVGFNNAKATWTINAGADQAGLNLSWQWAAAVYTQAAMATNFNAIGVKPTDDKQASVYQNSDRAGTPENFKSSVVDGAMGSGGTNYTGTYMTAVKVAPSVPAPIYVTNTSIVSGTVTVGGNTTTVSSVGRTTIGVMPSLANTVNSPVKSSNVSVSGNSLSLTLTNTGSTSQVLNDLNIIWPSINGNLVKVTAGATTIFSTSKAGPEADISTFLGASSARTLGAGQSVTLTFTFANTADVLASNYGFLITLSGAMVLI